MAHWLRHSGVPVGSRPSERPIDDEGREWGRCLEIDVLAPSGFNDARQNGFQAILAGDKTPEQQAADLQAAWEAAADK